MIAKLRAEKKKLKGLLENQKTKDQTQTVAVKNSEKNIHLNDLRRNKDISSRTKVNVSKILEFDSSSETEDATFLVNGRTAVF